MGKIHGKSVLLGMGIGAILTALLGFIFFLGYQPEMDEDKVKELAREYGMIEAGKQKSLIVVEVSKEDTLREVTRKLVEAGLLEDAVSIQIKIVNRSLKDEIIPGIYEFKGGEDEERIIEILTSKQGTSP